jgi:hypothetical protein
MDVLPPPPPRKSYRLLGNVEKYCRSEQATDDNMAHAHCILDTSVYKHSLRICNIYCFFTATMVERTLLDVNLYGHLLSCLKLGSYFNIDP